MISLVKDGYIEKQIVDILIVEGYKLSKSNARHMIRKVVKNNNLNIKKYSPVINSIKTPSGAINNEHIYLKRSYIFKYLWMDVELSKTENDLSNGFVVSVMLCVPVWHQDKISYLSVPLRYCMWQKKESKLEFAI